MSITVVSNTESNEAANATLGDLAKDSVNEEKKSASEKSDETTDDSEASDDAIDGDDDESAKDGDHDDESSDADRKAKKPKGGFQKRIHKLTSKLSAKEQEAEYWKGEALKASKSKDPEQRPAQKEAATAGRPKEEEFDSHAEYVEALTDWKLDQKLSDRDARDRQTKVQTEFQKRVSTHVERVNAFKSEHDDFDEALEDVDDIPISVAVQEVILDSDNGPELMYELAKNRAEYARICALSPLAAARELGKFESKLNASSDGGPKEVKKTKAPAPITPVGSKSASSGKKSIFDPNLSQAEYERLREEQRARRRA